MSRKNTAETFWARVDKSGPDGCWLWRGCVDGDGYGMLAWNGRVHRAHRVAFELVKGPIPDGLQLDHLCRTRPCVNPDHLEAVTSRTNTVRGENWVAAVINTNCCRRGHALTPENTRTNGKRRWCRTCRRTAAQRSRRAAAPVVAKAETARAVDQRARV